MRKTDHQYMEREFDAIWDSLRPEIREDMERLDHRLRTVYREAIHCGVSRKIAERKMRERFVQMVHEIGGAVKKGAAVQ